MTPDLFAIVAAAMERVSADGLPALAPHLPPATAAWLRGVPGLADFRPRFVPVQHPRPDTCRVVRNYLGRAAFALQADGGWGITLGPAADARRSPDRVVGLPDGLETLAAVAALLADAPTAARLRVYLTAAGGSVPLAVFAGFAAAPRRLAVTRVTAVEPLAGGRAGEITVEGEDRPLLVRMDAATGRLVAVNGRPADTFLRHSLSG